MPRQRMLHPSFFRDVKLASLSTTHRVLFAGLWCWADREGRLKDDPEQLRIDVLPLDECDPDALLSDLEYVGVVQRYAAAGARFIQVRHFDRYQHPHNREPASTIPAPDKPWARPGLALGQPRTSPSTAPSQPGGVGDGVGDGVRSCAGQAPAAVAAPLQPPPEPPKAPVLKLTPSGPRERKPSKQESFNAWAQGKRADVTADPDQDWGIPRINKALARPVQEVDPETLSLAYLEFLEDEHKGGLDPPWPMWAFAQDWPSYVSRVERESADG